MKQRFTFALLFAIAVSSLPCLGDVSLSEATTAAQQCFTQEGIRKATVVSVRQADGYALALARVGDTSSSVILKQSDGGWNCVHALGGAPDPQDLEQRYHVPASVVNQLLGRSSESAGPAAIGTSAGYSSNVASILSGCRSYLDTHALANASVAKSTVSGNYGGCLFVTLHQSGEVVMQRTKSGWTIVTSGFGFLNAGELTRKYRVPAANADAISAALFQ
jgi:hypothetical protein